MPHAAYPMLCLSWIAEILRAAAAAAACAFHWAELQVCQQNYSINFVVISCTNNTNHKEQQQR